MSEKIEIHMVQNHSPANLNRDDLGAPKTCFFGGVLRTRISSQCLKRSIRMSREFEEFKLARGVRTRHLATLIAKSAGEEEALRGRAEKVLAMAGFKQKTPTPEPTEGEEADDGGPSKALIFTTLGAIKEMGRTLKEGSERKDEELAKIFAELIAKGRSAPDIALFGRMLEPAKSEGPINDVWKDLRDQRTVEASVQVAHAISTHEARPEVDYYITRDDIPGDDAGAGYVDEAMFASACFYKYFSIDWNGLIRNLADAEGAPEIARGVVSTFLRAATRVNPSGKQNSFAAHNLPDGILVEVRNTSVSYANAFAKPVVQGERDVVSQSIAQLAQYAHDLDTGYGKPAFRFWFSPNLRHELVVQEDGKMRRLIPQDTGPERQFRSLEEMVEAVVNVTRQWDMATT
jgi:CRISPR system Cascade subunit CasC